MSIIENLRGKSENYRKGVALGTSLAVTLVIFAVWVTVLFPGGFSGQSTLATNTKTEQPVATFGRNVASAFAAVKFQFSSFSDYFKEVQYENQNQIKVLSPDGSDTQINSSANTGNTQNTPTNKGSSVVY